MLDHLGAAGLACGDDGEAAAQRFANHIGEGVVERREQHDIGTAVIRGGIADTVKPDRVEASGAALLEAVFDARVGFANDDEREAAGIVCAQKGFDALGQAFAHVVVGGEEDDEVCWRNMVGGAQKRAGGVAGARVKHVTVKAIVDGVNPVRRHGIMLHQQLTVHFGNCNAVAIIAGSVHGALEGQVVADGGAKELQGEEAAVLAGVPIAVDAAAEAMHILRAELREAEEQIRGRQGAPDVAREFTPRMVPRARARDANESEAEGGSVLIPVMAEGSDLVVAIEQSADKAERKAFGAAAGKGQALNSESNVHGTIVASGGGEVNGKGVPRSGD